MSRDALAVGINTYQYLPGLRAPAQDAEAIAKRLQTAGEFRVRRLPEVIQNGQPQVGQKTKATLRELEAALVNLFKPSGSKPPQTALFYFSGHGIQREAGIREGYLAVTDSQPDVGFYGLSLFWLRRLLQESPVRQRIILLDCCHSGEFLNFLEADPGAHPGTDRLFMAASRDYESAYESLDSPYSVFTQALLTGLDPKRLPTGIVSNHSLIDWVSKSLKGELQQPLFESSGSEIILTRGSGSPVNEASVLSSDICPYRGLECFEEIHADYFFGRDDLTDQLIDKLRTRQFVTVIGASGSGKSSLVRAGLIADLRRGQKFSGSDRWHIKVLTPTEHPLKRLAASFIESNVSGLERAEQLRRAEQFLQDGGKGLAQLVRASLPIETMKTGLFARTRPHVLLVIDQFEEVFTLCRGPQAEQERQHFFNCLLDGLRFADDCISIVIVLRADFVSKCSLYEGLAHQIEQNLMMVTPLTYDQVKDTIVLPAQKVGLVCEPNLIHTMLLDVIGAPGELPLLQYTLLELWQRRQTDPDGGSPRLTLDTYTELGGVRGTLQKRATELFYSLAPEEQRVAKRIFLGLTQLGEGTEDTRRRVLKSELISPAYPVDIVNRTLEKLVAAKLVVTSQTSIVWQPKEDAATPTSGEQPSAEPLAPKPVKPIYETIDVAHEALIRNWTLLRNWLDESREMLRRQRRIEQAAQEWDIAGKPIEPDYLLRGGRLLDAEDFGLTYPHELSALAQQYLASSLEESQRAHRELRLLQLAVPSVLLVALLATFNQYRNALQNQAEREYQLQIATSRERAAIAQAILQEPDNDPMAALLISRLAAESSGSTYEAQSSLRAVLRDLRLQVELKGHTAAVRQVAFSPDQRYLATAGADGKVYVWSLGAQTIHVSPLQTEQIFSWTELGSRTAATEPLPDAAAVDIRAIAFSPDSQSIAAIADGSSQVKLWSVESGALMAQLEAAKPVTQVAFSPDGQWIAIASTDRVVSIWQTSGQLKARLPQPEDIASIQFSPNGQHLLIAGKQGDVRLGQLTADAAQRLQVTQSRTLAHPAAVDAATLSPSGRWLATLSADQQARLWDVSTGQLRHTFSVGQPPEAALPSASDAQPLSNSNSVSDSSGSVQPILFSPNEQFLAVSSADHRVWLWAVSSGKLHAQLAAPNPVTVGNREGEPDSVAFSPDSQLLVTASRDRASEHGGYTAFLWDVPSGKALGTLSGHAGTVEAVQFSRDGNYIATASADGVVRLWSAKSGGELPPLHLSNSPANWALFLPGQHPHQAIARLALVSQDGRLEQWHISNSNFSHPTAAAQPPTAIADDAPQNFWQRVMTWMHPRRQATAASNSFKLPRFQSEQTNSRSGEAFNLELLMSSSQEMNPTLSAVAFHPTRQVIATATRQGDVNIQRLRPDQTLALQHRLQPSRQDPQGLAAANRSPVVIRQLEFNANGSLLLGVGDDLTIRLWDVTTGQELQVFQGHQSAIQQAHFSPDGQHIVSASWDRTVRIWETSTGQLLKLFPQQEEVNGASFSANGKHIVVASWNGTARVIDAQTGLLQVFLTGHRGAVLDARFSPDGRSLITVSADGTARLWDAQTGTEQAQLRPNSKDNESSPMIQGSFSPDGRYVATLTENGRVYLWAATRTTLLELARDRSLRQLTSEECIHYLRLSPSSCPNLALSAPSQEGTATDFHSTPR